MELTVKQYEIHYSFSPFRELKRRRKYISNAEPNLRYRDLSLHPWNFQLFRTKKK